MGDEAIYSAASGALVQAARLEVLSNNLANINTVGYKEDRAIFRNYMPGNENSTTGIDPDLVDSEESLNSLRYLESNSQVKFEGTKTSFEQGPLRQTENPLDFAIFGNGFFCVEDGDGNLKYSRKGTFSINEDGDLVTQDGLTVLEKNGGEITLTGNAISVDEEGNISSDGNLVGTIKIIDFDKPYSLIKEGGTLFAPANETVKEIDAEDYQVRQGFSELSNVNPIKVMTEMIEVHRAFESYQRVMRTMDETVSKSVNTIGRSA